MEKFCAANMPETISGVITPSSDAFLKASSFAFSNSSSFSFSVCSPISSWDLALPISIVSISLPVASSCSFDLSSSFLDASNAFCLVSSSFLPATCSKPFSISTLPVEISFRLFSSSCERFSITSVISSILSPPPSSRDLSSSSNGCPILSLISSGRFLNIFNRASLASSFFILGSLLSKLPSNSCTVFNCLSCCSISLNLILNSLSALLSSNSPAAI